MENGLGKREKYGAADTRDAECTCGLCRARLAGQAEQIEPAEEFGLEYELATFGEILR